MLFWFYTSAKSKTLYVPSEVHTVQSNLRMTELQQEVTCKGQIG